ncbi:MAG: M56 family metallopeptidase [Sedimentisphaerales bacterium]|nr:M56 family metallopeptidase [Sedimentisphaerales bacterium]
MEWTIEQVNRMGGVFVGLAFPMFLTSAALIASVLSVEFILRTRVRAALRYWLVVSVLAYLLLIPFFSLSPPSTHRLAGAAAYASPTCSAPVSHNAPLSRSITGQSQTTMAGTGERPAKLTWQGTVFVLWLAGVLVAGGLLVYRAATACRQIKGSPPANLLMKDILAYCRKRMRVWGKIQLKVSEEGTQPVVCGLLRPVIVVPRNLAPSLGSRHLRDVLFHELAHVKRCDLWVHLIQNCVQVLYFYNPLLLFVHAALRRLRDEAADEAVRDTLGDADLAYRQRLADVATLALKPPTPSLAVISVA